MYGIVNGLKTSGWKKDVVMYRKRHFLNNGLLSSVTRRKSALAESRNNEACNEMTKSFRPITKRITKPQEKRRRSFRYFSQAGRKSENVEVSALKKCMIIQSVQTQFAQKSHSTLRGSELHIHLEWTKVNQNCLVHFGEFLIT